MRTSSSGRNFAQKAERRSWGRGRKGHRILRRVPDDGRHPGQSRATALHKAMVTAALAALSPIRSARKLPSSSNDEGETARTKSTREDA